MAKTGRTTWRHSVPARPATAGPHETARRP